SRVRLRAMALRARGSRRGGERPVHRGVERGGAVPLGGSAVSDPVRVVVVGAGAIAQVAHLPALRRLPGVEVAAICDSDAAKAQALAARFQVPDAYDDIEDVLRYARAAAAVICTPNHLHESHVVAALAAGLHVMCERPLVLTAAGVERDHTTSERYGQRGLAGMRR